MNLLTLYTGAVMLAAATASMVMEPDLADGICPFPKKQTPCVVICKPTCDDPFPTGPQCNQEICLTAIDCVCPRGMVQKSKRDTTCVKLKECDIHPCAAVLCLNPFVCVDGACVCPEGTHSHRGDCVSCPAPKIFKRCPTNCPENCEERGPRSCTKECNLDDYCVCPKGLIERSKTDRTCIHPLRCPVDKCAAVLCPSPKICKNGKCLCPQGTHLHEGDCVTCPKPKLYRRCPTNCPENCEERVPRPCTKDCNRDSFCICPPGLIERSKTDRTCITPSACPPADAPCSLIDCIPNSICIEAPPGHGKCICMVGYMMHDGKCIDRCATMRCSTGACKEGKCICREGYVMQGNVCVPKKCPYPKIFNDCPTMCPPTCDNPDPEFCTDGCRQDVKCVCRDGYLERSFTDTTCVKPWECKKGTPCKLILCGANSICIEDPPGHGKCVCKKGYMMNNGQCIDRCAVMFCGFNSICREGQCICKDGYVMHESKCIKTDPCALMYCAPPKICRRNSDTGKGECVCRPGYDHYGDECDDKCDFVACRQPNTECKGGKCVCIKDYRKKKGICRAIGSCHHLRCRRKEVCVESLETGMGKCECKPDFVKVKDRCIRIVYG